MYDDNSKATIKERINKHIIDTEPGELPPMRILLDHLRDATEKKFRAYSLYFKFFIRVYGIRYA